MIHDGTGEAYVEAIETASLTALSSRPCRDEFGSCGANREVGTAVVKAA
jgi:hypothetical protein